MTLLRAIEEGRYDAVFGGARRDEEKARAKERFFSFRDAFGQWDPKNQRPELWNLYNGRHAPGEHIRVFPLSNWTELDVWRYIARERIEVPVDLLRARARGVRARRHGARRHRALAAARRRGRDDAASSATGRSATPPAPARSSRRPARPRRSSTRSPPRGSPSAARPAPTTGPARPPWRTARRRGTSRCSDLLRFATAGSVDDGKSTLIGRLLYDTKSVFQDQLESVERTSADRGDDYTNLALLTDGLRAEREQGITIDVAYRYFSTPVRSFIVADTPGHVQYTRNMVTGASTADLALVLVDARKGVIEQTRRHAALSALLRVPHLVLAVNKMDLVGYDQGVYADIVRDFTALTDDLRDRFGALPDVTAIPMAALQGDNVVHRSEAMRWYDGPSLLEHLEQVHVERDHGETRPARFPVQYVIRPMSTERPDYRGYAGTRRQRHAARRRRGRRPAVRPRDDGGRHRHLRRPARRRPSPGRP